MSKVLNLQHYKLGIIKNMKRKILICLITGIFCICLGINNNVLAYEFNKDPNFFLSLTTKEREELFSQKKDPAGAAILSGLCFGTGQMYGGDFKRGMVVMGVGLVLAIGAFGIVIPDLDKRPATASGIGKISIYTLLGVYWLWNIRDAYYRTVEINEEIDKRLLISE